MESSAVPSSVVDRIAAEILDNLQSDSREKERHLAEQKISVTGKGNAKSAFVVTDLATAVIGVAGIELGRLLDSRLASDVSSSRAKGTASEATPSEVVVDRRLASMWFSWTLQPEGWSLPNIWDDVAGNYQTADGWIRLHTNAAHHRASALRGLGFHGAAVNAEKRDVKKSDVKKSDVKNSDVVAAVFRWKSTDLENTIVEEKGCAAEMRSMADWEVHPQGAAVASEPLIHVEYYEGTSNRPLAAVASPDDRPAISSEPDRPLAGLKVLDCTRVLAGPACTRFLAGFGAEVLRIDPLWWNEPGCTEEMSAGKRCAGLDLRNNAEDRQKFEKLLAEADIFVHGYRSDALENLGFGFDKQRAINPQLISVAINAYGWTGPWTTRRGFDSLVQMSTGIAHHGMMWAGADKPVPLPVQALDHACGYLAAAAAIRGVTERRESGRILFARVSLARTAKLLVDHSQLIGDQSPAKEQVLEDPELAPQSPDDIAPEIEATGWGPAKRLRPPLTVGSCIMKWDIPAGPLRTSEACFVSSK